MTETLYGHLGAPPKSKLGSCGGILPRRGVDSRDSAAKLVRHAFVLCNLFLSDTGMLEEIRQFRGIAF